MSICLNSAGLVLDAVGAGLISYEIWSPFKGKKYRDDITIDDLDDPVKETAEFIAWERKKYSLMFTGLIFLVVGFGLQLLSNFV